MKVCCRTFELVNQRGWKGTDVVRELFKATVNVSINVWLTLLLLLIISGFKKDVDIVVQNVFKKWKVHGAEWAGQYYVTLSLSFHRRFVWSLLKRRSWRANRLVWIDFSFHFCCDDHSASQCSHVERYLWKGGHTAKNHSEVVIETAGIENWQHQPLPLLRVPSSVIAFV